MYVTRIRKIPNMTVEEVKEIAHRIWIDNDTTLIEKYKDYMYDNIDYNGKITQSVISEGIYWRKANAIHNWFVENVQDGEDECNEFIISLDELVLLKEVCKEVLEDRDKAEILLPTINGFFFGGTGYDEYYFEDLEHTVSAIEEIEKTHNSENEWLTYQSSW